MDMPGGNMDCNMQTISRVKGEELADYFGVCFSLLVLSKLATSYLFLSVGLSFTVWSS
jgi:hypothetical protein